MMIVTDDGKEMKENSYIYVSVLIALYVTITYKSARLFVFVMVWTV